MKKYGLYSSVIVLLALSLSSGACAPTPSVKAARSDKPRELKPAASEEDVRVLAEGNNDFALDLYNELRTGTGNLIASPYSISLALAMTYAGARGETAAQMANAMHFTQSADRLHPAFNALDLALEDTPPAQEKSQQPLKLNIANAVWAEQTYPFVQDFLDLIAENYGAGIQLADFMHQFDAARDKINLWVSHQTEDRINDLLPDGSLDENTRMVLVNAIYFKADWLTPFDADSTVDGQFHLLDGSEATAQMMQQGMFIPYEHASGYQAVELPYAGQTAAMDIIVPDEGNFETFDSAFNTADYEQIINGLQPTSVSLTLPKFKFDAAFDLPDALKSMGVRDAFESDKADFSGMTGARDLFIGNVIHKAFVAVDEKGTEAAAATAVIMEITSVQMYDVTLQVDRPFIFIIRDLKTGQILFIGRVLNPGS